MAKKKNQKQRIIEYVEKYGSITPMQAINELGITKLATRVSELKKEGYEVRTQILYAPNRYGDNTRFARYSNIKRPKED